jgi:hypothetical protein
MSTDDQDKEAIARMEDEGCVVPTEPSSVSTVDLRGKVFTTHDDLPPFAEVLDPQPRSAGLPSAPSAKTVYMGVTAALPFLRQGKPANAFRSLRKAVIDGAGFDFLATLADMMRHRDFKSGKVGVANRSRHKCGDAFDYDQSSKALVVVSEPHGLQQFFRTWLRCAKQDGSQGVQVTLRDIRGPKLVGWYFDFTAAAERLGWQRIPAWKGWGLKGSAYNKMEFWHYQSTEGLSFDEAMEFLYASVKNTNVNDVRKPASYRILGLNDRGSAVRNLQDKLSRLKGKTTGKPYLDRSEVDGVYGKITQTAVKQLQNDYGLDADGLVGPHTRNLIDSLV